MPSAPPASPDGADARSGGQGNGAEVTGPQARAELEQRWLHLTRTTLPHLAAARAWPVSADHCFQRILLDYAVGGCWYDHIAGRPAYRHIEGDRLAAAVALGEAVVAGTVNLAALNTQSLVWRGKTKRTPGSTPG